jgi:RHS repeat-associated protein
MPDLEFAYDASGNRVSKIVKPAATKTDASTWTTTYYVRDASGNVMATYEKKKETQVNIVLKEQMIYGSSRIGLVNPGINVSSGSTLSTSIFTSRLGIRDFEGMNHLGNVLVVFSDRKIPVASGTSVASFSTDIITNSDYYSFGSSMTRRGYKGIGYRYGFNGKEKDEDIGGGNYDFGARIYNARLGRWMSVDPLANKYPYLSPYNYCANNPIIYIDYDGKDFEVVIDDIAGTVTIKARIYTGNEAEQEQAQKMADVMNAQSGNYVFETKSGKSYKVVFDIQSEMVAKKTTEKINEGTSSEMEFTTYDTQADENNPRKRAENDPDHIGNSYKGGNVFTISNLRKGRHYTSKQLTLPEKPYAPTIQQYDSWILNVDNAKNSHAEENVPTFLKALGVIDFSLSSADLDWQKVVTSILTYASNNQEDVKIKLKKANSDSVADGGDDSAKTKVKHVDSNGNTTNKSNFKGKIKKKDEK